MKNPILISLLVVSSASGQVRIPGPGGRTGGGTPPSFVQASATDGSASTSTTATPAQTTTATDAAFVGWSSDSTCDTHRGGSGVIITNTGNDTYTPLVSPSGSIVLGVTVTNGGSLYALVPTATISGGGGTQTLTAGISGGAVTSIAIGPNSVPFTSQGAIITITPQGADPGTGATAVISSYGSGVNECQSAWFFPNLVGTSNNVYTVTQSSAGSNRGIISQEFTKPISGLDLVVGNAASGASISSSAAYGSGSAGSVSACVTRVQSYTQSWTPGSGYTLPAGSGLSQPNGTALNFMNAQYQVNFNPNGTTPSMSSAANTDRILMCASFH